MIQTPCDAGTMPNDAQSACLDWCVVKEDEAEEVNRMSSPSILNTHTTPHNISHHHSPVGRTSPKASPACNDALCLEGVEYAEFLEGDEGDVLCR